MAKGLINLQAVYGVIPNVYGKGKAAKQVYDYMSKLRKEMIGEEPEQMSEIDNLIIIDRQIDLITPLSTQLTYEGLIDEMFGIRFNTVKLPANRFIAADATESGEGSSASSAAAAGESNPFETEKKTILLNSSEDLYTEIRDKNFNGVGPALSAKAKYVSSQRDVMQGSQTVKELRMFVDRMPLLEAMKQSVATHTCIAEMIKEQTDNRKFLDNLQVEQEFLNFQNTDRPHDYLEEAALWGIELPRLLRTMCLQSVVNSGLKPKVLNAYRKELVCEAYGHKHMITLQNLEKVGLLTAQSANRNYAVLRKRLNLTMDDVNEQEPSDIAYVHSVYAPLSIRLIQNFFQPGWKSIRDVLDLLPGPTVDEKQALLPVVAANSGDGRLPSYQRHYENPTIECGGMKKTLVVFVGGCTYAEISALRFLSTHEDSNSEYLIATTSVINGTSFIESVMTDIPDAMDPRDG